MFRTKKINCHTELRCPECRKDKLNEKGKDAITLGEHIKKVQELCYLGDVLDCEAGVERAVSAAWKIGGI